MLEMADRFGLFHIPITRSDAVCRRFGKRSTAWTVGGHEHRLSWYGSKRSLLAFTPLVWPSIEHSAVAPPESSAKCEGNFQRKADNPSHLHNNTIAQSLLFHRDNLRERVWMRQLPSIRAGTVRHKESTHPDRRNVPNSLQRWEEQSRAGAA